MEYESDMLFVVSGEAEVLADGVFSGDGGIVVFGEAPLAGSLPETVADGGLFFTGGANVYIETAYFIYESFGGGPSLDGANDHIGTGDADFIGGVAVSGSARITANFYDDLTVSWRTRKIHAESFSFTWNTGARPYSWFRVSGANGPRQCSTAHGTNFVVNILARNIAEVCSKLESRNFPGKIQKVERFSTPAFRSVWDADTNPDVNCLSDVTPDVTSQVCVALLVDYLPVQRVGWFAVYMPAYYCESVGGLSLSGQARPRARASFISEGAFAATGDSSDVVLEHWRHEPEGGPAVVGEVAGDGTNTVVFAYWEAFADGSVTAFGESAIEFLEWGWDSEGLALPLGGEADAHSGIVRDAFGGVAFAGEGDIGLGFWQYGDGVATLSGEAFTAFPEHTYGASGLILVTEGNAHYSASDYHFEGDGGVFLQGGDPFEAVGGTAIGGDGLVEAFLELPPDGAVSIVGEADVIPSVRVMDGTLSVSGQARVFMEDLGTFVTSVGWHDTLISTGYAFRYQAAPELTDNSARILTRCCQYALPPTVFLDHRLDQTAGLGQFLIRNGITMPTRSSMRYTRVLDMWHDAKHYSGYAAAYPLTETWDIVFTLRCLSLMDGVTSDSYMEFAIQVKNHTSNGRDLVHRFRVRYPTQVFCSSTKTLLNFPFILDVRQVAVSPGTDGDLVLHDEIGLYRSPRYDRNPRIRFKISDFAADIEQGAVDLGPSIGTALVAG